jgi:subtilisin family serine protease
MFRALLIAVCLPLLLAAGAPGHPAPDRGAGGERRTAAGATQVVVTFDSPPLARARGSRTAAAARIAAEHRAFEDALGRAVPAATIRWRYKLVANGVSVVLPRRAVALLNGLPGVREVVAGVQYEPQLDHSVAQIGAPALWGSELATAGSGIKIGIIDTGLDQSHPFFSPKGYAMPPGFPKGQAKYTTAKVIVARAFPPPYAATKEAATPFDPAESHGTHVAGIAAGNAGTRTSAGRVVSGVAPRAYIGNYKALTYPTDSGFGLNGNSPELVAAIEAAVADGMDVINLSLGEVEIEPSHDLVARALDAAAAAGVVPVAVAGNDLGEFGRGSIVSPGSAADAITVGAVTPRGSDGPAGVLADFSSSGPTTLSLRLKPDVAAPGVNIASSIPGGWGRLSGTSMAAPHVAGAAALLRERHPSWSVAQLKSALVLTGDPAFGDADRAAAGSTQAGGGIVNLVRADTPLVFARPTSLSFGLLRRGAAVSETVDLADAGGGAGTWSVSVETVSAPAGAALLVPGTVEVPGALTVTASTTGAGRDGELSGWVVLSREGERRRVPVWLRISTPKLHGHRPTPLSRPGVHRGNTAGRPSLVRRYRYPEHGPAGVVQSDLAGPEQVFRVRVTRRIANFGVAVVSARPGVRIEPRTVRAGDEDRQVGYTSLPVNLNAYLADYGEYRPVSGAVAPAIGAYDVVFDTRNRARAGPFTFRFWVDDTTPPRLAIPRRTVPTRDDLLVRAGDGGAGVDPESIVAEIDGNERIAVFRDGTVRIDLRGLAAGRHRLRLQVSDYQESRNTENVARILPNTRVLRTTITLTGSPRPSQLVLD